MRPLTTAFAAFMLAAPAVAHAQADLAAQQIDRFDHTLLEVMKDGKALGFQGRYRRLEPAVTRTFNLPLMIRFAVGPSWSTLSADDQQALLSAFTRYSTSTWARNFSDYGGENFKVGAVDSRGPDKLVHSQILRSDSAPIALTYRMQASGGGWKVIDVYFNGAISQLSQQRADYASTLASGGPKALAAKINDLSDKQAKGS